MGGGTEELGGGVREGEWRGESGAEVYEEEEEENDESDDRLFGPVLFILLLFSSPPLFN